MLKLQRSWGSAVAPVAVAVGVASLVGAAHLANPHAAHQFATRSEKSAVVPAGRVFAPDADVRPDAADVSVVGSVDEPNKGSVQMVAYRSQGRACVSFVGASHTISCETGAPDPNKIVVSSEEIPRLDGEPYIGAVTYGWAPPGTTTVDVQRNGGHVLRLATTEGPDEVGKRAYFVCDEPAFKGSVTFTAKDSNGTVVATRTLDN